MKDITIAQMKYLKAIYKLQNSGADITSIASELKLSKPSALTMVNNLLKMELVNRGSDKLVYLSDYGKDIFEEFYQKENLLIEFLKEKLNLSEQDCEEDAIILLMATSENFSNSLINKIRQDKISEKNDIDSKIIDGTFAVPFKILKKDENKVSMGNKGFIHPCRVDVKNDNGFISLKAKEIYYKTIFGKNLYGKLKTLYYFDGTKYIKLIPNNDIYKIPYDKFKIEYDNNGNILIASINIKAQASVGVFYMPESEAKLVLNLIAKKKVVDKA